uniref:Uncharacterized protein n=1 Tax=Rhizophora mucronata TaxID=61149 RepID=A0A2P2QHI0_RHIMU
MVAARILWGIVVVRCVVGSGGETNQKQEAR